MIMWLLSHAWWPGWMRWLILTGYLAVAISVTVHALFKQSNVRTALGWIGIAWFSPFLGAFLYYVFGINRVARRAVKLERTNITRRRSSNVKGLQSRPQNIGLLAELGLEITGHSVLAGNRLSLFCNGDEAYPAMLSAIREAEKSVALASYIFRNDEIGRMFIAALAEARSRGVEVCVLLDGIGSGYFSSAVPRRLRAANISAERFLHSWLPWRMPFLNIRNHKKLLIVDGKIGFTGGMNIGAEYSATHASDARVDDVHVRLEGPVVGQLMESFAQDWSFTTDQVLDQDIWWPMIEPAGSIYARGISSGPDAEMNKLEVLIGAALVLARRKIRIVTPYFLPDQNLQFALAQAKLRGVAVDIVIPEHCDFAFVDWAMRAHLRYLLDDFTVVYATKAPFDHAKLMTVDGEWALVGSSNWDVRSLRLNFELDVECYGEAVTAEIDALIDKKIARSRKLDRLTLMQASKWAQLRDAAARLFLPYL
jgi:cardiolipin synthase